MMFANSRKAFTLVELLVVIGIIALLISILLPALQKARSAALKSACLSNQRQLVMACIIYAQENKGSLPPSPVDMNASLTWECYFDPAAGFPIMTGPGYADNWFSLGHLFHKRLIKNPQAFYCPEQRNGLFTYPDGWENSGLYMSAGVKCIGYHYRVFGQFIPGMDADYVNECRSMRMGKMKGGRALIADFSASHYFRDIWPHQKPLGLNVAYSDGHAEFVEIQKRDFDQATQITNLVTADLYVYALFRALDQKDFTELHAMFP